MTLVMLGSLGQELFQPPNVKGWDGGIAWITTNNLLDRYNFAAALVEGQRVPLPGLINRMKGMMNNLGEPGLMQISPADVKTLFTPAELTSGDDLLAALQARYFQQHAVLLRAALGSAGSPAEMGRKLSHVVLHAKSKHQGLQAD